MAKDLNILTALSNVSKIRLPGGMVGKVSTVLIVACVAMATMAWSVHVVWVSVVAIALLFVLCFVMLWRVISFADKNPQAAILEGAEFLLHEQLMLGTKATPLIKAAIEEYIEAHVVTLSAEERRALLQPDAPPGQLPSVEGEEVLNG